MAQRSAIRPTREQQAAVDAPDRLVIIEANAGAAKTTTLALRIRAALAQGVAAGQVLALTFTEPGCAAMARALDAVGVDGRDIRQLQIQTFDAFCAARLRPLEAAVAAYDAERAKPIVLQAIAQARASAEARHPGHFMISGTGEGAVEGLLSEFLRIKGSMQRAGAGADFRLTPRSAEELGADYTTLAVLDAYEGLRRGALQRDGGGPAFRLEGDATYDLATLLLADDPAYGPDDHPLSIGLRLVLVDEMHDMGRAMFTVLAHLLERHPGARFVGVGDTDQVIHAAAGADPAFMREAFDAGIGRAARFSLSASFRFGPGIAGPAGAFARKAYASSADRPTRAVLAPVPDAKHTAWRIEAAAGARDGLARGSALRELAVLLRHPYQSVALENGLMDRGIDYRTVGFLSYLMRPEVLFVRGLLAYALGAFEAIGIAPTRSGIVRALMLFSGSSILTDPGAADPDQIERERQAAAELAAVPHRFADFVENQVLKRADPQAKGLIEAAIDVARANRTEDVSRFLNALQPRQLASRVLVHGARAQAAQRNIVGLMRTATDFSSLASFLETGITGRELRLRGMANKDCITLSTIEAAKGLEYDHVMIPFVDAGSFDGPSQDDRNLFYVAITRARHVLTLMHDPEQPSGYLRQAGWT